MDYRERLQRPQAYNVPGHAHELTCSCFRRLKLFSKERSCQWLSEEIQATRRELKYWLWAYVFMPDHIHLIVYPQEDKHDTSQFLKRIKEPVGRRAVRFLKSESPDWLPNIQVVRGDAVEHRFWQPGRGHDRNIKSPQTLQSMIDYVHLNPVRKGLVERAADWKWSSAGWFVGRPMNDLEPDPIPWDWLESNWSPQ